MPRRHPAAPSPSTSPPGTSGPRRLRRLAELRGRARLRRARRRAARLRSPCSPCTGADARVHHGRRPPAARRREERRAAAQLLGRREMFEAIRQGLLPLRWRLRRDARQAPARAQLVASAFRGAADSRLRDGLGLHRPARARAVPTVLPSQAVDGRDRRRRRLPRAPRPRTRRAASSAAPAAAAHRPAAAGPGRVLVLMPRRDRRADRRRTELEGSSSRRSSG